MGARKTSAAAAAGRNASNPSPVRDRAEEVKQRAADHLTLKELPKESATTKQLPSPKDLASLVGLENLSFFQLRGLFDILNSLNCVGTAFTCQPRCNKSLGLLNDVGDLISWYNEISNYILDRCIIEARSRVPSDEDEARERLEILIERDLDSGEYSSVAETLHGIRSLAEA